MLYLLKQMQELAHKNTRNDINQLDLLHLKTNLLNPMQKFAWNSSSTFRGVHTSAYSRKKLPYYVVKTITCNEPRNNPLQKRRKIAQKSEKSGYV